MSQATDDPRADLADAVAAVLPRIREAADRIERDRRLPAPLVEALHEARLFRMLLPRSVGGLEVDPTTFARTVEAIARADASVAWCIGQASGCSMMAAYLEPAVARRLFGDPRAQLAWGQPSPARAVPVAGGYRVTARWAFASGSRHATLLGGVAPIVGADGSPRLRRDGTPDSRIVLFPAERGALLDVWHVSGLRGTGSDTIAVDDLFVPAEETARQDAEERREPGPLYLFPYGSVYPIAFASVALGIGRATLDAFVGLAADKVPQRGRATLRENAVVQAQVARSEALLGSARAYLHGTVAEVWEAVRRDRLLTLEQRVRIRLATTFATHQAATVVDTLFHAAGSSAIFEDGPFERRFRDVHAVMQQVQGRQAHFETVGQFLLGLEPDLAYL